MEQQLDIGPCGILILPNSARSRWPLPSRRLRSTRLAGPPGRRTRPQLSDTLCWSEILHLGKQMRASTLIRIIFLLVLTFLFSCSDDKGIELIDSEDPLEPPEKNHVPVIAQQPDTRAIVGDTLRLKISATDQDGDDLSFAQQISCTWEEVSTGQCHPPINYIDFRTGSSWFYPRTYDVPERHVVVLVSDEHGAYAYMEFVVSVIIGQ